MLYLLLVVLARIGAYPLLFVAAILHSYTLNCYAASLHQELYTTIVPASGIYYYPDCPTF